MRATGTIGDIEGPPGWVQIGGTEGYALCSSSGDYWDIGTSDSGNWSDPVVYEPKGPNTLPLTITRASLDGRFSLVQEFAFANGGRSVQITMKPSGVGQASFYRYAEVIPHEYPMSQGKTSASAFTWSVGVIGLLMNPKPSGGVFSYLLKGGANPCAGGGAGNPAMSLKWMTGPKTTATFLYSAIQ